MADQSAQQRSETYQARKQWLEIRDGGQRLKVRGQRANGQAATETDNASIRGDRQAPADSAP